MCDNFRETVVVAMLGARMHYAVPGTLAALGTLKRFFTDSYLSPGSVLRSAATLVSCLPNSLQPGIARTALARYEPSIPLDKVTPFNLLGVSSTILRNACNSQRARDKINLWTGRTFCKQILSHGLPEGTKFIYAYKTAALELFHYARANGIKCIIEQTIVPKRIEYELLRREFDDWKEWQDPIALGMVDEMALRESREWDCADLIVGGSKFVIDGLAACGVPPERCLIVPYAVNPSMFRPKGKEKYNGNRPLRLLFAGEVGLRKGIPYLYQALKRIDSTRINCKVVGKVVIKPAVVKKLNQYAQVVGQVPKFHMPELFNWADVFVLPTVCEGSATVTYEALASGVPVITTPNSGSIIQDGKEGFICPAGDAMAIAGCIEHLMRDPKQVEEMSHNAVLKARNFSWDDYGERLRQAIQGIS